MATHSSALFLESPRRQRSLAGHSPCGHKESGMTEQLTHIVLQKPTQYSKVIILPLKI